MDKIVCVVMGGVVQNVYFNGETEVEVEIIDLDNESLTDKELKKATKDLEVIY